MHHTHATNGTPSAHALGEQLSALMDGECTGQEVADLSQALAESSTWPQTWQQYELVGHALRAHAAHEQAASQAASQAEPNLFVKGVMARVQAETPVWGAQPAQVAMPASTAANDSVFRWKVAASVATMAAVVSVAWQMGGVAAPTPAVVAAVPAPAEWQQVQTPQGTMLRDPELEALMAAHRQQGGMTALQMPAGFLRTATFDSTVR